MNDSPVATHLRALGMTAADAESRASLVHAADDGLRRTTGAAPAWRWFVPGRLEIFGKHVDYAGGCSLLAAVPRGFAVVARPRADARVRVFDVKNDVTAIVDLEGVDAPDPGWRRYVQVVARRFASNFPGAALGVDVALTSDLPRAAGVSSSSALVVGLATALVARGGLDHRPEWCANVSSPLDLAWYLGCVESGGDFRRLAGTTGVGTLGGSEDHTAILTCRAGRVSHVRFVPTVQLGEAAMPAEWVFVVASSGVHADKAGRVREAYNRTALAACALVRVWQRDASQPTPSLAAILASSPDAPERLRRLAESRPADGFSSADLVGRLSHFVREDSRAAPAARAFAGGDRATLSQLSLESQRDADELLGNQVPETRALAAAACAAGAFAASSFGAGFGGSVWALVDAVDAEQFAETWVSAYRRAMPHVSVAWFVARPGPALVTLPV